MLIPRPLYLDKIISRLNRDMIIILIGQRRVGKSFMLRLLHEWILKSRPDANVVYINKELQAYSHITDAASLYSHADRSFGANGENYLLIDELQDIKDYENALRSLQAERRCQIVATGSNAYLFSSQLSTRLAGRYVEIPVYSLDYREFLKFHDLDDSDESMLAYLRVGGLPGLSHFDISDEGQVNDYLQGVYNTVMMRDVVSRENIRNTLFLENLSRYVADNTGKLISSNNIASYTKSQGDPVSGPLVSAYLRYLRNALIIRQVPRFDIRGKHIFEQNFKYYFSDHGLRNFLCGFNLRGSIEKVIENAIYHHLKTLGYRITVGVLRAAEIDFVATKGEKRIYVQATYLLASEETVKREFGNLAAIPDNYPKYVVSMDPVGGGIPDYPGVEHLRLRDFLKSEI